MVDLKKLKTDADCFVIAESLGIDISYRGSKALILCPNHADRHLGSCFLTEKHYKCYSCQHTGDCFDLVRKTLDVSFEEAVNYVAETCGGEENYLQDFTTPENANMAQFLNKNEQRLIGLIDTPVYGVTSLCDSFEEAQEYRAKGYRIEDFGKMGYGIIGIICQSPLREIFNGSPFVYREWVSTKCQEQIDKINSFYSELLKSGDFNPQMLLPKYAQEIQAIVAIASKAGAAKPKDANKVVAMQLCNSWGQQAGAF